MQISFYSPTHGGFREWEGHEVKSNETMVGIALKYDITVEDIRRCNNLWTNDALWPGQVIFLYLSHCYIVRVNDEVVHAMKCILFGNKNIL